MQIFTFYLSKLLSTYLMFFFLLTPFFIMSTFVSITDKADYILRKRLAWRISIGTICVSLVIFFAGSLVMRTFGITVDAFRAGSGALLLLTAVSSVLGRDSTLNVDDPGKLMDMAVVPLAVPMTAGPATLGTLLVLGTSTEDFGLKLVTASAIVLACLTIGLLLIISHKLNDFLGHSNIIILSKITGLILSAIAMQMLVIGAKNLWVM